MELPVRPITMISSRVGASAARRLVSSPMADES